MPPPIIILLFVLIVAAGIYAWRLDWKRQEAMRTWAFVRGWRTWPGGAGGPQVEHPGLALFERGHSRSSGTLIRGEHDGQAVSLFDYKFVTGHGKHRTTHRYGVVVWTLPFPVQPLQIRPENALDRIGEFLGATDINFESAEFSRRFYVTAPDRKWAYDVIHARMMEYLLQAPPFAIEFGRREMAVYRRGYAKPADYDAALELLAGIRGLMPEYVIRQQKGDVT